MIKIQMQWLFATGKIRSPHILPHLSHPIHRKTINGTVRDWLTLLSRERPRFGIGALECKYTKPLQSPRDLDTSLIIQAEPLQQPQLFWQLSQGWEGTNTLLNPGPWCPWRSLAQTEHLQPLPKNLLFCHFVFYELLQAAKKEIFLHGE